MNTDAPLTILRTSVRTFARLARGKLLLLPPLMLVAGLFEGVGIVLFVPVLESLASRGTGVAAPLFGNILATLHLESVPLLLGAIALVFLIKFSVTLLQQIVVLRITRDLYRSLAGRLLRGWASSEYRALYLRTTTGTLTNVLTRELWTFLGAFSYACLLLVHAITIAVYVAGSFLLDPRITVVALAFGGTVILALRRWTGIAGRYSIWFSEENVRFQDRLIEFLQHFKYLKATARFPTVERRLQAIVERMTTFQYRMGVVGSTVAALPEPMAICILLAFLYGSTALVGNAFATTAVLGLLLYRTLMRILALQTSWQKFVGCSGSLRTVQEALTTAAAHPEPCGTVRVDTVAREICFEDVHFSYSDRPALTGISLRFPARRTVALVGPSGGGKSTIVDLLTGVLTPTAGRVAIDGADYRSLDRDTLRAMVGYVAQEIVMFNDTVANNIALWEPTDEQRLRTRCAEASCDFIDHLPNQFATGVGDRGINLSVGQRQRIAIARELFRDPQLLIFDEATSALDSASEEIIRGHIERLAGQRTIVLIAHRLSTIRHADYVYVIDGGRVVEEGTFECLAGNPASKFHTMCALQMLSV